MIISNPRNRSQYNFDPKIPRTPISQTDNRKRTISVLNKSIETQKVYIFFSRKIGIERIGASSDHNGLESWIEKMAHLADRKYRWRIMRTFTYLPRTPCSPADRFRLVNFLCERTNERKERMKGTGSRYCGPRPQPNQGPTPRFSAERDNRETRFSPRDSLRNRVVVIVVSSSESNKLKPREVRE